MIEKNIKKRKDGKYYVDFTFNKKRIREFGGYTKEQARNTLTKLKIRRLGVRSPSLTPSFSPLLPHIISVI